MVGRRRSFDPWLRVLSLLGFIALWELAAAISASPLLPGPMAVAANLQGHLLSGDLLAHLGITLWRVAVSFVIAMANTNWPSSLWRRRPDDQVSHHLSVPTNRQR